MKATATTGSNPGPWERFLRGPFNFLEPDAREVALLFPEGTSSLPMPYPIYSEDESSTAFYGIPVLADSQAVLRDALFQYLDAEEEAQLAVICRQPFSRNSYSTAWGRYQKVLVEAAQNATMSSYGRNYPAVFWLMHSLDVARRLKEVPRRILRTDLELGRKHGDQIKYRVFEKYRGQARLVIYEALSRLAADIEDVGQDLVPAILQRMFDNVLIFTEDHISTDLAELASYLAGFLGVDARDFRQRLERLVEWHNAAQQEDSELKATTVHLLGLDRDANPRQLIFRSGYVTFLAAKKTYRPQDFLMPAQIELWESLLLKLKEFEFFDSLRRLILPVKPEGNAFVFRAGGLDRTWIGQRQLLLSSSTRPLDFLSPSVIEPLVHRCGLIYDITSFSEVISHLRRAGQVTQEVAFRQMFRFQRRINRTASSYRLQLEKYLGDGAFYTSRNPATALLCAIHLQRLYRLALTSGLPFNQGMRIGLNFGHYRLIPIQGAADGEPERYEFFGHGVVELSRLTSGKNAQELDEIKNLLLTYGYPAQAVMKFFEPLAGRNLDLVDKEEEARSFYAYVSRNGSLINEGIVATAEYLSQLIKVLGELPLQHCRQGTRSYAILTLDDHGVAMPIGFRKLGVARLKGLDQLPVYEIIDAAEMPVRDFEPLAEVQLVRVLDRLAAESLVQASAATR